MGKIDSKDILSSAVGTLGIGGNIASTLLSNEANKSLMSERNQMAIDQWRRENEYNLPKNQVERLLAAGLNPALMYENGASGLVSATSPDMQAAQFVAPQVDPLTMANIAKLNAETQSIEDANSRENEKQPLTLETLQADIDNIYQSIDESESRMHLNAALTEKAYKEADKLHQDFLYLRDTLEFRIKSAFNDMSLSDIKVEEERTQFKYLEDTLKQTLDNLRATYELIKAHAYFYEQSGNVQFSNSVSQRLNALSSYGDFLVKINEVEGRLERWDNLTLNERLRLVNDGIKLGNDIYQGGRVKESVTTEKGGGKPSKTTTKVSRSRSPKAKGMKFNGSKVLRALRFIR